MSDVTTVTLTVLSSQAKAAKAFAKYSPEEEYLEDSLTYFIFYEVNAGDLPFLSKLETAGIAFDSNWSHGDNYGPGCKSCRFTSTGDIIIKTVYDGDSAVPLDALLPILQDHAALIKCIRLCQKHVAVLPWDDQEKYGKVYLATKLINPS